MENRRSMETINGEIQLPEPIIQHIQSFLNGKEAARTSVLSKSWYIAWSTQPHLDFDQRNFPNPPGQQNEDAFSEFSRKSLQRYENTNRKIETLRLWMYGDRSLGGELISRAIKLGAENLLLELSVAFVLPEEVLGSKTLISLSATNCIIDQGKVSCTKLTSLSLCRVWMGTDPWDIISSCPLMETLVFSECWNTSHGSQLSLTYPGNPKKNRLYKFHNLKTLVFERVQLDPLFFSDFPIKFPCLESLFVHHCIPQGNHIEISSRSIKHLSFAEESLLWAAFDVPRIRKFSFSGKLLPVLYFGKALCEWETDISLLDGEPGSLSLVRLKQLLKNLRVRMSRINLSLNTVLISEKNFEYAGDVEGLHRPTVENLMLPTMNAPLSLCSALLGCLFWSCRPKFIAQCSLPGMGGNDIVGIVLRRMIQVDGDCYIPNRGMFGQCDLEEVEVQCCQGALDEWQPMQWKELLNASGDPENKQHIRFRLRWGAAISKFLFYEDGVQ